MRFVQKAGSGVAALLGAVVLAVAGAPPAGAVEPDHFPGSMREFLTHWSGDVADWWTSMGVDTDARHLFPATGEGFATACGHGPDDAAAFYCPADDTVVFSQVMATRIWEGTVDLTGGFGGQAAGDMGVVYALAHEFAHDVQFELGLLDAGHPVMAIELHADCWAGAYLRAVQDAGQLDTADVDEAITAAARMGDYDYANPMSHGTPEQRVAAFRVGFTSGEPRACDDVLSARHTG